MEIIEMLIYPMSPVQSLLHNVILFQLVTFNHFIDYVSSGALILIFTDVLHISDCVSPSHLTVLDIIDCLLWSSDSMIIQRRPVILIRLGFKASR